MLLAPAVVDNLLANPDVAVNLEAVLRRVMPLDWREQGAVFALAAVSRIELRNWTVTAGATIVAGCFKSRWLLALPQLALASP